MTDVFEKRFLKYYETLKNSDSYKKLYTSFVDEAEQYANDPYNDVTLSDIIISLFDEDCMIEVSDFYDIIFFELSNENNKEILKSNNSLVSLAIAEDLYMSKKLSTVEALDLKEYLLKYLKGVSQGYRSKQSLDNTYRTTNDSEYVNPDDFNLYTLLTLILLSDSTFFKILLGNVNDIDKKAINLIRFINKENLDIFTDSNLDINVYSEEMYKDFIKFLFETDIIEKDMYTFTSSIMIYIELIKKMDNYENSNNTNHNKHRTEISEPEEVIEQNKIWSGLYVSLVPFLKGMKFDHDTIDKVEKLNINYDEVVKIKYHKLIDHYSLTYAYTDDYSLLFRNIKMDLSDIHYNSEGYFDVLKFISFNVLSYSFLNRDKEGINPDTEYHNITGISKLLNREKQFKEIFDSINFKEDIYHKIDITKFNDDAHVYSTFITNVMVFLNLKMKGNIRNTHNNYIGGKLLNKLISIYYIGNDEYKSSLYKSLNKIDDFINLLGRKYIHDLSSEMQENLMKEEIKEVMPKFYKAYRLFLIEDNLKGDIKS